METRSKRKRSEMEEDDSSDKYKQMYVVGNQITSKRRYYIYNNKIWVMKEEYKEVGYYDEYKELRIECHICSRTVPESYLITDPLWITKQEVECEKCQGENLVLRTHRAFTDILNHIRSFAHQTEDTEYLSSVLETLTHLLHQMERHNIAEECDDNENNEGEKL